MNEYKFQNEFILLQAKMLIYKKKCYLYYFRLIILSVYTQQICLLFVEIQNFFFRIFFVSLLYIFFIFHNKLVSKSHDQPSAAWK